MSGYSRNPNGELGTDGVLRDVNGRVVPTGVDADTKAQLQEQLDGPKVRILPSEHDILKAAAGGTSVVSGGEKYVYPNESEDAAAIAFKPGYDITGADSTGVPDSIVAETAPELPSEVAAKEFADKEREEALQANAEDPAPETQSQDA